MNEKEAIIKAIEVEKKKEQCLITTDEKDYWCIEIDDEPEGKIPEIYDINGVKVKKGDTIEFSAILDYKKKARAKVRWSNPYIACASGVRVEGNWIGNGVLNDKQVFKIIKNT